MQMTRYWARKLAWLGALFLAACSVSPDPISDLQLKEQAKDRLERAVANRTPVKGMLTLADAVSRAVHHNMDHRVEVFETALRQAELGVSTAAMLPGLVASASRTGRDNVLASSSYNVLTGTQNFGASTSQDQRLRAADLSLSWNILDFGLSYVRARQAADKVLIAHENRRRVVHKLVEEVRTAYWRAYAADQLRDRLRSLERRTLAALRDSRRLSSERETSPMTAITYRRELIEIRRTLQELQRELASAKMQLAALINEKPDAKFKLAPPKVVDLPRQLAGKPHDLVLLAYENRPELREISYRRRINTHELDAALLELLPGLQLYGGPNFDSNSFVLHEHWLSWGARASWNLMRLFQYPARRDAIEAQDAVLEQRDLAMTLTVMTQIHVSRARIAVISRELATALEFASTQNELLNHVRAEHKADRVSEQTLLREELTDVVGHIRKHLAEASLQSAHAALAAATGIDPVGFNPELPPLDGSGIASAWRSSIRMSSAAKP